MTDTLEALLHRCHRDELVPLAERVGVNHRGLGLGDLSRAIATAVRQQGSHELGNMAFRGGQGRPYVAILHEVARKRGIATSTPEGPVSVEQIELAVVRKGFAERWERLDAATRDRLWRELGVAGPPPSTGEAALKGAVQQLGRSFGYVTAQAMSVAQTPAGLALGVGMLSPVGLLLRPLLAPLLPAWLWWKLRPDPDRVLDLVLEIARLRQIVLHRVTIGVVGSPSTGKDAAIKTLFGIDTGNISPIAGSTKEVAIQKLPGSTATYLVNTPGMGDVVERVTEEAKQVLDHIDVYLYLVNAEGGVQAREQQDHARCRATGKPVLAIVNKIDVLRPRDKEKYLADARDKLGAPEEDFAAVAFDPLPQLSETPINVETVHAWLVRRLVELGKDVSEIPPYP